MEVRHKPPGTFVELAIQIKIARENAGLSQRAFATKLGISESYVVMIEQGYRQPSTGVLVAMAYTLGCDDAQLFAWAKRLPPDIEEALLSRAHVYVPLIRVLEQSSDDKLRKLTERLAPKEPKTER